MRKIWRFRVTNECNAQCFFCHGESQSLSNEYIYISLKFVQSFINKNVNSDDIVAITGGEPLLHPDIFEIIKIAISKVNSNVHLNTNGILLSQKINELANSGLKDIHINIASFDSLVYKKIYNSELSLNIIDSIIYSVKLGMKITINCVIIKNINDDNVSILKMIDDCSKLQCNLSFIEEYIDEHNDKSKGLNFQNRFELLLVNVGYNLKKIDVGRKIYSDDKITITIAAPCAPHFAWNTNEYADSFVILENQQIKKFSSPDIIKL
jgi:GTP 3',8-cyclase